MREFNNPIRFEWIPEQNLGLAIMGEGGMPIGQVQNMSATFVYIYMYILNLSTIKCIAV